MCYPKQPSFENDLSVLSNFVVKGALLVKDNQKEALTCHDSYPQKSTNASTRRVQFRREAACHTYKPHQASADCWYNAEDYQRFHSSTREIIYSFQEDKRLSRVMEAVYKGKMDEIILIKFYEKHPELLGIETIVSSAMTRSMRASRELLQEQVYDVQSEYDTHLSCNGKEDEESEEIREVCCRITSQACHFANALAQAQARALV